MAEKVGKHIKRNEMGKKQMFHDMAVDKSNSGLNRIGTLGLFSADYFDTGL